MLNKNKPQHNKILLVDDEKDFLLILSDILKSNGFKVINACNAEQALKLYDTCINLVLTDVVMEEMDGIQLIKEIRKINPRAKCAVMTAYTNIEIPSNIDVLVKPAKIERILNFIDALLVRN